MGSKRVVGALAGLLAAASVAVGSGATFSSQSANPANTFASGTLVQANSKAGVAIVTGANLKPGDVRMGEVTISNTGSLAGTFKLAERNGSNGFAAGSLKLKVEDVTGAMPVQVFSGDFGGVPAAGIGLGSFAAGEARTYRFTVSLDQAAGNGDQGKSAAAEFDWTAVQS